MVADIQDCLEEIISGDVALAIRDAELCGKTIKQGDYLGMFGDEIVSVTKDKISALMELLASVDKDVMEDKALLTVFWGSDISEEEAAIAEKMLSEQYSDLEINCYKGNQPVYSFLIGLE